MTNLDQKVRELRALAEKWLAARARPASNIPRVLVGSRELDAFEEAARPETMLAILDEYDRRGAALVEADGTLHEAREFINRYSDVRDGDYGAPEPNEAMQLVHTIDQTAAAISQEVGK